MHMTLDRGCLHVAMLHFGVYIAAETSRRDTAVAGGDVNGGRARHHEYKVSAPAGVAVHLDQHRITADRDMRLLGVKDLLRRCIAASKGYLVRLHREID